MKFKYIANACGIITGEANTRILMDPWLNDGVMEGSWCHCPPITSKISDYQDIDLIYLSHLHPDHYDTRFFDFPKDTPIVILDEGQNFLKKILIRNGYNNLLAVKDGKSIAFKEFELSLFAPWQKYAFEDYEEAHIHSMLGNLIDSALLVQTKNHSIINFNDNKPNLEACKFLKGKYGKIDLALLNFNAANCYPACFDNLTHQEKISEKDRIIKRNYDNMIELANELMPVTVMPFAGTYILGGKEHTKNQYLAAGSAENCKNYIQESVLADVINLSEHNEFDLSSRKINGQYVDFSRLQEDELVDKKLKQNKYPYEEDPMPDITILVKDLKRAALNMKNRIEKFGASCKTQVFIKIQDEMIEVHNSGKEQNLRLECSMDLRLLRRVLDRKANWNNAEIGAHINFMRSPNTTEPDIHTALQFLHL